jgi:hypothetical protein
MAYKFQLGAYTASGSLTQEGAIECDTSLTIGSAVMSEADLEKLDGITDGTAAANKAIVLDASRDIANVGNITSTGNVTAGGSFIIGSADLNETDLEKLDGITDGTAAANKAVVLDASKNIATIGTIGCGAITSTGTSTFAGGVTPAAADGAALGSASKEWADLYLADGGIAYFGNDQDVRLSHVADSGLMMESTNAGAANAAMLKLQLSSSTPADNDEIGKLVFSAFDDAGNAEVFGQILMKSTDVSNGSEDGSMELAAIVDGTPVSFININGTAQNEVTFVDGAYNVNIASHDGSNGLKLGGTLVTATAAELNYLDISAAGAVEASKALIADSSGLIEFQDGTISGLFGAGSDANALVFGADKNFAIYYDEAQSDGLVIAGLQNSEASVQIVADEADDASVSLIADQGDDAGDGWRMIHQASDNTLQFGNDIASQGTYVSHLTITPNSTVASSTAAFKGHVTVAGDLTVNGTTTSVNSTTINVSSSFTFEGAANAHETTLHAGGDGTGDDPQADTTLYLPALSAGSYYIPALADKATAASAAVTAAEFALLDGGSSVGTTALASGDGFLHNDAGTMKQTSIDKIADLFAGDGISASSAVLALDINGMASELSSATVADTDEFAISDGGTMKKIDFQHVRDSVFADVSGDATIAAGGALTIGANAVEGSMLNNNIVSGLTDIGADIVATDELIISDGGTIRRTDMSRLKTYIGSGQQSVTSGSYSAGMTLSEGINYFGTHGGAITATLPSDLEVGESVKIKVGSDCSVTNKLTVSGYANHTIDGSASIILESPFAAVECVYVVSGSWRVF